MYIKITVKAGVNKESFIQKSKDHFVISTREKAEHNMANIRVIELVAENFKVSKNKVRIVNGHRPPGKLLTLDL